MKILLFSGTHDGKTLAEKLADLGNEVTVSVATEYGAESQGEYSGVTVISGARPPEEIASMLAGFDAVIDATHPYATHIRESIKSAAEKAGKPRLRLARETSEIPEDESVVKFTSLDFAAAWLSEMEGNVMITTGAKELSKFSSLDPKRLFPRVLPLDSSLKSCEEAGIPRKNVIAMQGPFTEELNVALMKQFDIKYLVTKDSGKEGGFGGKLGAAEKAGATLVLIERPDDEGLTEDGIVEALGEF